MWWIIYLTSNNGYKFKWKSSLLHGHEWDRNCDSGRHSNKYKSNDIYLWIYTGRLFRSGDLQCNNKCLTNDNGYINSMCRLNYSINRISNGIFNDSLDLLNPSQRNCKFNRISKRLSFRKYYYNVHGQQWLSKNSDSNR